MPWIKNNIEYSDYQVRNNHRDTSFPADLTEEILTDFGYIWQDPIPIETHAPPVPRQVTMRQARLALLSAGLLQTVNDTITAMPGTQGEAARIEWEYALSVDIDSQLVQGLTAVLGLTTEQLDNLFTTASQL